ncbi:type ISP restriction/modification enzyme [uncultured Enterovirga sp.]|uniref:type ISP restriction/modification enzyme n=1 Tax=uncultured Enterovirga sp. TaxID=2026352 RepID=UPI0035CC4BDA
MAQHTLQTAISAFGASAKAKLANPAIKGAPEDQLRGPLETLVSQLSIVAGQPPGAVQLVGETTMRDLQTRPDYAVTRNNALIGFIEVKAPGKGADPKGFTDLHDKAQWSKLSKLPNLLYTDGNSFSLWQDGERQGSVIRLDGDVGSAGAKLSAPDTLLALIDNFLGWNPITPKTARKLAPVAARLCRFLRDEVVEQMGRGNKGLTDLATDWRKLLFPEANDAQFADGYAQAVTFGLLVARARGISLAGGIEPAASALRQSSSLIGTALRLLTDDPANHEALKTSLGTLTRVLEEVDWPTISKDSPDAWLYFYEEFLAVYDNTLRKRTGSYYTPPEVVAAMVRLVDEALRGPLFDRAAGLASSDVTLADPAVGTGTFLLGVLRRIADTVRTDKGAGAVPGAIRAAASRVVGFELQFGPFAVAQLRIIAEMAALMRTPKDPLPAVPDLNLFITDTLGNPYVEEEGLLQSGPIAASRRAANKVKREERITVVIGNPPYKVDAAGRGGWIEAGSVGRPSALELWTPPRSWGVGASTKHLKNLYVYFWRWATWKVFGSDHHATTGEPEIDRAGLICFITAAGFLNGPGFQKMRAGLRRDCSEIWVIDCSSDGHQPDVQTRIFEGVQQQICIVLAARAVGKNRGEPARVRFAALPKGHRELKFDSLAKLRLDGEGWVDGPTGWRDPLLPERTGDWGEFPAVPEFFDWASPGVKTHRTWVIAPDAETLRRRWTAMQAAKSPASKHALFHPDRDRTLDKVVSVDLGVHRTRPISISRDREQIVEPVRYAFRSFDRQWIPPDHRLLSQARSQLWELSSDSQFYLTAIDDRSPVSGPSITIAAVIPDMHHYHGRGGRVFPLWRDRAATQPNVRPELLSHLSGFYGAPVLAEHVMAYLSAIMAHPAFTARFAPDLVRPGLRVPLTADPALFAEAASLGREIVWLHCYGERFADPEAGRPRSAPRMPEGTGPFIPIEGAIPGAPEPLPETMRYDAGKRRLNRRRLRRECQPGDVGLRGLGQAGRLAVV